MDPERLEKQIGFIVEIDKLKKVLRQTLLTDFERRENSAEHSWHLALMAIFLAEHAKEKVDLPKVVKLVLIHDLVEIDAGDTYCYDDEGNLDKNEREQKAADRIFNLLPGEQAVPAGTNIAWSPATAPPATVMSTGRGTACTASGNVRGSGLPRTRSVAGYTQKEGSPANR